MPLTNIEIVLIEIFANGPMAVNGLPTTRRPFIVGPAPNGPCVSSEIARQ